MTNAKWDNLYADLQKEFGEDTIMRAVDIPKRPGITSGSLALEEEWRPIVGWEEAYEVSSRGRVRTLQRFATCSDGRMFPVKSHLKSFSISRCRRKDDEFYYSVSLHHNGKNRRANIHVLVLEAFRGLRPSAKHVARHLDDNKINNNLYNLVWGTHSDNAYDKCNNGRHPLKEKLTCPYNHSLEVPNLVASTLKKGFRNCLACSRARAYLRVSDPAFVELSNLHYERIMSCHHQAS